MSQEKLVIAFTKWHDPWAHDDEDEDDGYDSEEEYDADNMTFDDGYGDGGKNRPHKPVRSLMTPMGIVPFNEHSSPSKNWNFWVGHSNFRITRKIARIIAKVDGVETLDVFSPYRLRIGVAKLFQPGQVIGRITHEVNAKLNSVK